MALRIVFHFLLSRAIIENNKNVKWRGSSGFFKYSELPEQEMRLNLDIN
jgi:hypothetical protein